MTGTQTATPYGAGWDLGKSGQSKLISEPGRRSDVRQSDARLRPQTLKRRADPLVALSAPHKGLDKDRMRVAPHDNRQSGLCRVWNAMTSSYSSPSAP
jgi:hypothetical protein